MESVGVATSSDGPVEGKPQVQPPVAPVALQPGQPPVAPLQENAIPAPVAPSVQPVGPIQNPLPEQPSVPPAEKPAGGLLSRLVNSVIPGATQAQNPVVPVPQPTAPAPKAESKVYTDYKDIQRDYFPEKLKSAGKKWMAQKSNVVVLVGKSLMDVSAAIPYRDGKGNLLQITQISFGGYKLEFDGFNYVSKNKLEEEALDKQPKIICMGPA